MDVVSDPVRVLAIPGSLRAGSFNARLLAAAIAFAPRELSFETFRLDAIPPYNQDVENAGEPESVLALRRAVVASGALLIASPEYNYGVPGLLKNAIDWVSRPGGRSPLQQKPVAIMGASGGPSGTMRMQVQLRVTLQALDMYAMPRPEIVLSHAADKFDAEGRLIDEKTREHVEKFMAAFAAWIHRFR